MRKLTCILAAALLAACNSPADPGVEGVETFEKPEVNPSEGLLDDAKADYASNRLTTIKGAAPLGERFEASIGYPDYLHGYTLELTEGQVIAATIKSTHAQVGAVYGPHRRFRRDGRPVFRKPIDVQYAGRDQLVEIQFEAEADGVYMIVTGPTYVWDADYSVEALCLEGCVPDDSCAADDVCGAGEFCGDNGVRCFRHPCTANYDVCQPQLDLGAWCDRDAMCGPGLACFGDACAALELPPTCERDDECGADGWCGWGDNQGTIRICKPFRGAGELCGGFVPPEFATRCAPGMACVGNDQILDGPGNCSVRATVAELLADPAAYEGQYVALEGEIGHSFPICTQMACTPENPCCNSCGAEQQLFDKGADPARGQGLAMQGANDEVFGCGGNSCNFDEQCSLEEGSYLVQGWFRTGRFASFVEIDRKWLLAPR